MKLVIDISDELYNYMCSEQPYDKHLDKRFDFQIRNSVRKGTPLPKKKKKIVDIDKLIDGRCNECGHIRGVSCTIPCYVVLRMLDAPTLIEADKTERE